MQRWAGRQAEEEAGQPSSSSQGLWAAQGLQGQLCPGVKAVHPGKEISVSLNAAGLLSKNTSMRDPG